MKKKLLTFGILSLLVISGCESFFYVSSDFQCETVETTKTVYTIENTYTQVYDLVHGSVGTVYAYTSSGEVKVYTGTIIKEASDGYYFITSYLDPVFVDYEIILGNYQHYQNDVITLVGSHKPFNLSLLKITTTDDIYVPKIAHSSKLIIGESILALGTPEASSTFNTLTKGIISGTYQSYLPGMNMIDDKTTNVVGFLFDAPTNYGERGGGVFNLKGELVGIISERYYSSGGTGSLSVDSMTFALGTDELKTPINQIIEKGSYTKPKMGITVMDLFAMSTTQKETLNIEGVKESNWDPIKYPLPHTIYKGLFISEISPTSGAADANIPLGHIITQVNEMEILRMAILDATLMHYVAGESITVTVMNPTNLTSQDYTITLK